jgi:hypothetical protein
VRWRREQTEEAEVACRARGLRPLCARRCTTSEVRRALATREPRRQRAPKHNQVNHTITQSCRGCLCRQEVSEHKTTFLLCSKTPVDLFQGDDAEVIFTKSYPESMGLTSLQFKGRFTSEMKKRNILR